MAKLHNIIAYLLKHYPHKTELSNARVTKMVYLADWHHAIRQRSQMSPIQWVFDNYGPFVWDVANTAKDNPNLFDVDETRNIYGGRKCLLSLKDPSIEPSLTPTERESLDHVINATKQLTWDGFVKLVYSTFPIVTSQRYNSLDLVDKAKEYMATRR